jgi:phosphomevalonate kinase
VTPRVRAPGKALLAGEYAVLTGATAVVAAVTRYARAAYGDAAAMGASSPFVSAALRHAAADLHERGLVPPAVSPTVDTSELHLDGAGKLGLGSSAAATVAAAGAVLAHAHIDLRRPHERSTLLHMALTAHRTAQAAASGAIARGSGADVAASVYGGVLAYSRDGAAPPSVRALLPPRDLHLAFVYTGRSAATTELVAQVVRAGAVPALANLAGLAGRFAEAFECGDVLATIGLARRYAAELGELGQQTGAPIVTREHQEIAALAERVGGTAKPSGAGGGDIAVCFTADLDAATRFAELCAARGYTPLDLAVDEHGVRTET